MGSSSFAVVILAGLAARNSAFAASYESGGYALGALCSLMPRYRFHIYDDMTSLDEEGMMFDGPSEARAYAIDAARCLASTTVRLGKLTTSHRIEVVEDDGSTQVVLFGEAVIVL